MAPDPGMRRGSAGSPKCPESSTSIGRNRLPPAASRYEDVSASRSESASTAFSRAASTSPSRPRTSRSNAASGASRPGTSCLLMWPTLSESQAGSPSKNRRPVEHAEHHAGKHPEQEGEDRQHGYRHSWPGGSVGGLGVVLRLLHVHQHHDPDVEEGRHHAGQDPDQDEGPVAGADRRPKHGHLGEGPPPWAGCPPGTEGTG